MKRHVVFFLWALFFSLLFSLPAFAQNQAAAEALFRSAREAADQGDWVTACDRFEESYRLEPAPGTVLNIARCREKLEQWASAWKRYEEAAQKLPQGDKRVAFAEEKVREIEPRVPHIVLTPESESWDEAAQVTVDGDPLRSATFGVPLPFNPGRHVIVVRRKGRADIEQEVNLAESERLEISLTLGPPLEEHASVAQAGGTPKAQGEPRSTSKRWGVGLVSAGIAGGVVALSGATWALVELSHIKYNCVDKRCNQEGTDASARGRTAVILTGAGAFAAAVGIGFGSYLLLKGPKGIEVTFTPSFDGAMISAGKVLW